MYCRNCGQENADDATFCQKCGSSLKMENNAAPIPTPGVSSSSTSGVAQKASYKFSTAFSDAIALVRSPVAFMNSNRDPDPPIQTLMVNYVAVLAAIPFVATLIGDLWYHSSILGFYGFSFAIAIVTYILDVAAVFVVGYVIMWLGPRFGSQTTQARATRLAAYAFTPAFLIGILDIFPPIAFLTFLGLLYGLYILYLGMPILLNTPKDRVLSYVVVTVVATIVVYAIIGAIIGAVTAAFFVGFYYF